MNMVIDEFLMPVMLGQYIEAAQGQTIGISTMYFGNISTILV